MQYRYKSKKTEAWTKVIIVLLQRSWAALRLFTKFCRLKSSTAVSIFFWLCCCCTTELMWAPALPTRYDANGDCLLGAVPLCFTSGSLNCVFKSHWVSKHSSICEILTTSVCSRKSFGFHLNERQSWKKIVISIYLSIQEHTSVIFKQATWCKISVMNICSSEPLLKFRVTFQELEDL